MTAFKSNMSKVPVNARYGEDFQFMKNANLKSILYFLHNVTEALIIHVRYMVMVMERYKLKDSTSTS